eukprot:GFUD01030083.1.p1 GENE.GFUD01030083.1~~GFUD01030083.1.p1  ORF type:complete len:1052 (+),score=290.32 GFUD01030083.1:52-3156(+)
MTLSVILILFGSASALEPSSNFQPLPYVKNLKLDRNISEESSTLRSQFQDNSSKSASLVTDLPISVISQNTQKFTTPTPPGTCQKSVTCITDSNPTCYGTRLPYPHSSHPLTTSSSLSDWAGLQSVPACWAVVQPLLCSIFQPKCDPATSSAQLVPRHLCKVALKPCRVLSTLYTHLPQFLNCSDNSIFSDHCDQDQRSERARFNSSTNCVAPLLPTKATSAFWNEVEECGLKCQPPLLSTQEYNRVHSFIAVGATLSLLCSLFAVFTFAVDWKGGSRYPAVAIFYLNVCLALVNIGWLAQFLGNSAREDIVCRKDGVGRHQEPGQGENLSCVAVFILVYYFSIAASVWLVVVSYSWFITFTWASQPNKVKEVLTSRAAYFHLVAWSIPLVLTVVILALNKVDGDAVSGICFVGYDSLADRGVFVLLPHCVALGVAAFFTMRSVRVLGDIIWGVGREVLPDKAGGKVRRTVCRILVFSVLVVLCVVVALVCHFYRFSRKEVWEVALKELVLCNLRQQLKDGLQECNLSSKPSLTMLELELLCMFGAGILCSSWVWTRSSLNSWMLAVKQLFGGEGGRPVKLRKHQLIAQAFAKRAELQANGRLSLTFQSAHDDPLGLDIDCESSGDFSSAWAAALPHLVTRRGGLCGAEQLGLGTRRGSMESVSNISRSISIRSNGFSWLGSRKGSVDSTQSIQQDDLARLQSIYDETIKTKKRSKREFFKSHKSRMRPWSRASRRSRSGSITSRASDNSSVFSQFSQVLPAITLDPKKLTSKVTKNKFSLPSPGRSTDFGRDPLSFPPTTEDPTYRELEEKLRQLATASRTSNITDKDGGEVKLSLDMSRPVTCSIETQTEFLEPEISPRRLTTNTGTQMTPPLYHRVATTETSTEPDSKTSSLPLNSSPPSLPPLVSPSNNSSPLQHIEANVVNLKILGVSSEDSSIPSSYEKDYKMKKMSSNRGKENFLLVPSQDSGEVEQLNICVEEINIPALKTIQSRGDAGGGIMRPREHHRGRRGAIVQKLSPQGVNKHVNSDNTDS